MSKAISELNALCDVLSCMRTSSALDSTRRMYKRFCNHGVGTVSVAYGKSIDGKIYFVHFTYTTWIGAISKLSISTIKPY